MTRWPPGDGTENSPFLVPSLDFWKLKRHLESIGSIFNLASDEVKPAMRENFRQEIRKEWPWLYDNCYFQEIL